jgi:hypothetical protein
VNGSRLSGTYAADGLFIVIIVAIIITVVIIAIIVVIVVIVIVIVVVNIGTALVNLAANLAAGVGHAVHVGIDATHLDGFRQVSQVCNVHTDPGHAIGCGHYVGIGHDELSQVSIHVEAARNHAK